MDKRIDPLGFKEEVMGSVKDGLSEILSDLEVDCPECGKPMPVAPGVCTCPHCGEKFEVNFEA